ncbi:hypothetical protein SDC9_136999 [bioreactor metagenome]|uniref:Uncharacterized protein n=1 Tax=bioreactor metagenome TaxID=1076179 RepID=A0A645DKB1_9ZZZZ
MGGGNVDGVKVLNDCYKRIVDDNKNSQCIVYLVYSTKEHTYEDHIVHLIKKLDESNIHHEDQIETFPEHSMIGNYMKELCSLRFK